MKIRKNNPIYLSKKYCEEKHVDLLLTGEEKDAMFLSKISIHPYIIILHITQAFNREEVLKCHIKDCFKINGKQRITIPKKGLQSFKKGKYVKFKNYERKIKSLFIIYADF